MQKHGSNSNSSRKIIIRQTLCQILSNGSFSKLHFTSICKYTYPNGGSSCSWIQGKCGCCCCSEVEEARSRRPPDDARKRINLHLQIKIPGAIFLYFKETVLETKLDFHFLCTTHSARDEGDQEEWIGLFQLQGTNGQRNSAVVGGGM